MAGHRHKKNKRDRVPIAERKVYIPWRRQGFRFEPLPPKIPQSALDNLIDALAIRPDPKTYKVRAEALLIECLVAMNRTPPHVLAAVQNRGLKGGGLTVQTTSFAQQHQQQESSAELPANSPDLRKVHWTTIALLIHVYATARRMFLDLADENKQRMVYKKKKPQQQHQQKSDEPAQPSAVVEKKKEKTIAEDSDEEDNQEGGMVVEHDTDDESLFVKQRPQFDPSTQTKNELRFIALVDEWIQHVDAAKGLALSNKDIEAMELF
ncbi:mitochondrial inner membrane protease subunit [Apiospora arundinis]